MMATKPYYRLFGDKKCFYFTAKALCQSILKQLAIGKIILFALLLFEDN